MHPLLAVRPATCAARVREMRVKDDRERLGHAESDCTRNSIARTDACERRRAHEGCDDPSSGGRVPRPRQDRARARLTWSRARHPRFRRARTHTARAVDREGRARAHRRVEASSAARLAKGGLRPGAAWPPDRSEESPSVRTLASPTAARGRGLPPRREPRCRRSDACATGGVLREAALADLAQRSGRTRRLAPAAPSRGAAAA